MTAKDAKPKTRKRELAAKDWFDMNAYADAKTDVIESICKLAMEERES
jgi:GrpB-like predicted nucleotidyltransferase (UPF0157 family)